MGVLQLPRQQDSQDLFGDDIAFSAATIAKFAAWKKDPVRFVREVLKAEPDDWQQEGLTAFPNEQRFALKASKGPGKTTLLAWFCWNFLVTRSHPKILATSITADNLRDNLWAEMAKWRNNSDLLKEMFVWTKTRIYAKQFEEDWFMSARTWAKSETAEQQANTLAGTHADNMMFVLDESGGIPMSVMSAAEGALSSGTDLKIAQAGNPTHTSGPLWEACNGQRRLWRVIDINGDPENPKRAKRVNLEWAIDQIKLYGRDNPWVMVNVLGMFPPSSLNSLIGLEEVRACVRHIKEEDYIFSQPRTGTDVARFGDDRSCIMTRQGLASFNPIVMRNARTDYIASRLLRERDMRGSERDFVDGTGGYGAGVVDFGLKLGLTPIEINFGSKADQDKKFANKRAEMWWNMAEWLKKGGCIPATDVDGQPVDIPTEISVATYSFTRDGRIILEEKDQIKKRLQFSPDVADALALTFATPDEMKSKVTMHSSSSGQTDANSYDPFRCLE